MRTTWGRCNCPGHGARCIVSHEIQSKPLSKAKRRREDKDEINSQLNELPSPKTRKHSEY